MTGRGSVTRWGALALGILIIVAVAVVITVQVSVHHGSTQNTADSRSSSQTPAQTVQAQGGTTKPKPVAAPTTLATLGLARVTGARGGPSGVPMPHGNLDGWKQVFSDDFPSDEDSPSQAFTSCAFGRTVRTSLCSALAPAAASKWFSYPDGLHPSSGTGQFEPSSVVSIADHQLTFDLHPVPSTGQPALAAMEAKLPVGTGSVRYAAVAVRFKAQSVRGYALSFELWPQNNQGAKKGNMQFPAGELDGNISSVTVLPGIPGEIVQGSSHSYDSGWHTAVTEWTRGLVRYYLDGRQVEVLRRGVPSYPMNWVLQLDGTFGKQSSVTGSGQVKVAWVSAYVPTATHTSSNS